MLFDVSKSVLTDFSGVSTILFSHIYTNSLWFWI